MNLALNGNQRKKSIGFSHAWNGLKEVTKTERNFKIHLIATITVIIAGILIQLTLIEWAIIMLTIGLVLVAEATNAAVEKLIDYVKPDTHPLAKTIKDVAAGAVLLAALTALIVGMIIFLPKIYGLF
ncbi:undecaprenol kinase [Virgibacillus subterraneus]|uniref:Undecaprenol kinase n=1 Tax=Virgibacillus subterraneus TaxID=621109 RepID=A0A1H9DX44_9BACI|nr:undecaprenol kinase [Virgibacillus subterraneus]